MPTLAACRIEPMPSTIVQKMIGRDHHLDQGDEAGAERLEGLPGVGRDEADQDAGDDGGDDGDVEVVGAVLLLVAACSVRS